MEKLYTTKEVAKILKISISTLLRYIRDSKIKVIKLSRSYRISEREVNAFLGYTHNELDTQNPEIV